MKTENTNKDVFGEIGVTEEMEMEQAKMSAKYIINSELKTITFPVKPVPRRSFGRDITKLAVKLHPHWTKEIELKEADQAYIRILGMDKEYKATVSFLKSRKKGNENVEYIGMSVKAQDEVINCPFDIGEFKNLTLLNFIKEKQIKESL